MGSSDPSLVPEWLRCNGHGNSGGSAVHHFASATTLPDASLVANSARSRQSRNITEIDNPRANLDRSSSVNSRRTSSNNGSSKHPYSSFSKSHREKERDKEKERSAYVDLWERDSFDPLPKETLRRNRSMVSRKQADFLTRRAMLDTKAAESNNHLSRNILPAGDNKYASSVPKVSFEKDFPSLGADEKQVVPNIVRVGSPGLTIAAQGLPIGSSALVGEGWSALAEVPVVKGSNNSAQTIHQPLATSVASSTASSVLIATSGTTNTVSGVSNTTSATSNITAGALKTTTASGSASGLNMAEALVQSPSVTRTAPQISVENQRLEELAIKKVKQLIPVTPSMPKASNSSDKLKPKLLARVGEISGASKIGQQLPSSSLNAVGQSPRGGPVTSDASKQSHVSKLLVLKPPWENGASATSKEGGSNLENGAGGRLTNTSPSTPAVSSSPSGTPKASIIERRAFLSSLSMASAVEKRPLSSHTQSRSDFFNSVRKKTLMTTTVSSETSSSTQSPSEEKSSEMLKEMTSASSHESVNGGLTSKDDSSNEDLKASVGAKNPIPCAKVIPDEEEAAFLRSLGWEENCEEEEGLTEEEINAYFQEVGKLKPSLNVSQGVHSRLSLLVESHVSNVGGASPRVSSSDSALKSN
uniref:Uncharacterized protein n=1 Tax=Kalanchoe fedtschenkoi TaxID=63787 RepID=A0A7N0UPY4_KALFE